MSIQEIESQTLRLPPSQRALLAQHLIASLDEEDEIAGVGRSGFTALGRPYVG